MDVHLDVSFAAPSIASARYSSTSGFSGGLTTGSIFVLLPMPKKPVVVTVVAIGLYWLDSFRAWLAVSMDICDSDDSSGAEHERPKVSSEGVIGLIVDELEEIDLVCAWGPQMTLWKKSRWSWKSWV